VRWGTRLVSFEQDDSGVVARLAEPGGVRTVRAGWLVGCDGGHSTVRKALGLPLLGESTETWLLADARVETELDRTSLYWIRVGNGTCMAGPMPGENRWRMLDTTDVDFDGDLDAIAERFTRKLSAGVGRPVVVGRPSWVSVFTAQQRMVPAMRVGRCFVAGDAAHVHSPASGQGMNTGVQEAYNLAWKLAMVVHGHAGSGLLDSYDPERVPIGRELLGSTRKATRFVAWKAGLGRILLPLGMHVLSRVKPLRRKLSGKILGRVSGLRIGYPDSPLSRPVPDRTLRPAPGERVCQINPDDAAHPGWQHLLDELRDPRWTLLVFDRPTHLDPPWLSVRTVTGHPDPTNPRHLPDPTGHLTTTLTATPGTWLLIRPDGYLAARGTTAAGEAVHGGHLTETFAALGLDRPGEPGTDDSRDMLMPSAAERRS
jgi:NADPH-dependent dioxygenase